MLARFWKTISFLALTVVLYTSLSWMYIYTNHISFSLHAHGVPSLPTEFPSIWSFAVPTSNTSWLAPMIVLVLQVWFTGGFYGTLVRINARQSASLSSFIVDASKSFWRLFLWNFFWNVMYLCTLSVTRLSAPFGVTMGGIVLILRFLFIFGDVALVSEQQTTMRQGLKYALSSLLNGLVPMLPYGVVVSVVSDVALTFSGRTTLLGLLFIAILYGVIMTWLLHMIVARYLYFSNWSVREHSETVAS